MRILFSSCSKNSKGDRHRDKEFSGLVRQQVKGTRQHPSFFPAVIRRLHRAADTHLSGRDAKVLESHPPRREKDTDMRADIVKGKGAISFSSVS